MLSADQTKLFQTVLRHSQSSYVVGGVVRDLLLQGKIADRDLDIIIEGNAIEIAERCAAELDAQLERFPKFYTAKLLSPKSLPSILEIDFASSRVEIYECPGSLPTVTPAPIADDLKRRDFTINALAIRLTKLLTATNNTLKDICLDHFNGRADLDSRTIRILHAKSFEDDPTRLYRACRYEVRLKGQVSKETEDAAQAALQRGALETVSNARKLQEIQKICNEQDWVATLERAERWGLISKSGLVSSDFLSTVQSLKQIKNLDGRSRFDLLLHLSFAKDDQGEPRLKAFGFGKKHFNRWKKLKHAYENSEVFDLGEHELVAGFLLGYSGYTEILRSRGLL